MIRFNVKKWLSRFSTSFVLNLLLGQLAFASTTSTLPFSSTMTVLKDAISGPFLLAASIIMIVITCLMLAFGEFGDGFKKLINIVFWLSIAFGVVGFITTLFGSGAIV
jgi:type IV secretory pathway VirB2 component (pilin)